MPVANEGKVEYHPYEIRRPAESVKSCDLKEAVPMIERLQLIGDRMRMIACGLDNLNTRLFIGGENASNFEYNPGTGSADDAINSIAYLADISLKILDEIHTKL